VTLAAILFSDSSERLLDVVATAGPGGLSANLTSDWRTHIHSFGVGSEDFSWQWNKNEYFMVRLL